VISLTRVVLFLDQEFVSSWTLANNLEASRLCPAIYALSASRGRARFPVFAGCRLRGVGPGSRFSPVGRLRGVGKGPAIVVTEIVQVKDDRDRPHTSPPHQLQAGGMTTVSQQYMRPKPLQYLVGQVEKARRFPHVGRALGAWRPRA
jgi:hypothetical protein